MLLVQYERNDAAFVVPMCQACTLGPAAITAPESPTRISSRTSEQSCEEQDGSGIEESDCRGDSCFEVLGQTAVAPKPGKEAFDHPAPGMDGEANLAGLFADDLDDDPGGVRHSFGGISAIGEDPLDEGIQPA
jgi:hypothetical protein